MRIISNEEWEKDILHSKAGYIYFGGCGKRSEDGREVLEVRGTLYLFERDEVGNEEYNRLMKEQEEESREFAVKIGFYEWNL